MRPVLDEQEAQRRREAEAVEAALLWVIGDAGSPFEGWAPPPPLVGQDGRCGRDLTEWPFGACTEPAEHSGACDRRQTEPGTP